jgi:hypothetical protein
VSELVKLPVPDPSVVLLFEMVGFSVVLQHMPLAVTAEPLSLVILPPLVADVEVIAVIAEVEITA